jgi:hypothetical protein
MTNTNTLQTLYEIQREETLPAYSARSLLQSFQNQKTQQKREV